MTAVVISGEFSSIMTTSTFSAQTLPTWTTLPPASVCWIRAAYTLPRLNTPPLPAFFPHLKAYWQSVPVTRVSLNPVSKHRCNVNPGSRRRSWAHKGMCELGIAPCMWERPLTESVQQSRVTAGWGAGKQPDPDRGEDTPSPQGSTTQRDRQVTQRLWKTDSDKRSLDGG